MNKKYNIELTIKDENGKILDKKELECKTIIIEYLWSDEYYPESDEKYILKTGRFLKGMNISIKS